MLVSREYININAPRATFRPLVTNLRPLTSSAKVLSPRVDCVEENQGSDPKPVIDSAEILRPSIDSSGEVQSSDPKPSIDSAAVLRPHIHSAGEEE